MVLTQSQILRIQGIIDRIELSGGPANGTIDERTMQDLAKIFAQECGFVCGCPGTFREGLRDSPTSTLLRALICGGEGLVVPPEEDADDDGESGGPDMLSVCGYGVLSGESITNTGPTFISQDLGLHPGTSVTGAPTVAGTSNVNNAAALQAKNDLITIYDDLAGRPSDATVAGNIGGQTFAPGVYTSSSTLAISSGEVTLDGGGDVNSLFIFQINSALTVTSGRIVHLINGAQSKNVFWQVGSSATIGSGASFKGSIVALTSITFVTGATIDGAALARNGSVVLDTNTVVSPCFD